MHATRLQSTLGGSFIRRALGALLAMLLVLSPAAALAEAPPEALAKAATPAKHFKYVIDGDLATITGYNGPKSITKVVIPSKLDNCRVVGIGSGVFKGQLHIKSVKLPAGLEYIGDYAFSDCKSMASINLPSSVSKIGEAAFADCKKLKSIAIPSGVTAVEAWTFYGCTSLTSLSIKGQIESIGFEAFSRCPFTQIKITSKVRAIETAAFSGCKKLKKITVVSDNPYYSSENGILFNKDKTVLLICPAASAITNYKLPGSVRAINQSAFFNCKNLKSVTMNDQLTRIGAEAFHGCTKLKSVTLNSHLQSIESAAFMDCKSLAKIEIPEGVSTIEMLAFCDCARNMQVYLPRSLTIFPAVFLSDNLFPGSATLHVYANSPAHQFGVSRGYKCVMR